MKTASKCICFLAVLALTLSGCVRNRYVHTNRVNRHLHIEFSASHDTIKMPDLAHFVLTVRIENNGWRPINPHPERAELYVNGERSIAFMLNFGQGQIGEAWNVIRPKQVATRSLAFGYALTQAGRYQLRLHYWGKSLESEVLVLN